MWFLTMSLYCLKPLWVPPKARGTYIHIYVHSSLPLFLFQYWGLNLHLLGMCSATWVTPPALFLYIHGWCFLSTGKLLCSSRAVMLGKQTDLFTDRPYTRSILLGCRLLRSPPGSPTSGPKFCQLLSCPFLTPGSEKQSSVWHVANLQMWKVTLML
jgi:hypothetical protein